jgi:hypothetical protein
MKKQREASPIITIVVGLLMIGSAAWLYTYYTSFEGPPRLDRMHTVPLILYRIGGKWLTCGLITALGIAVTAVGIRKKLAG